MIDLIRRVLELRFFRRDKGVTGVWQAILWWELRRIPFNIIVGLIGIFSFMGFLMLMDFMHRHLDHSVAMPDPPLFWLAAIMIYGFMANVCYTGGWIVEFIVNRVWGDKAGAFAEIAFSLGLLFSILLTLTPLLLAAFGVALELIGSV